MPATLPGPGSRPDQTLSFNMRLLAHHELLGFGGIGEGMAMQLARDGRRILWLAHESAPKNFTGVDVTDPRAPRVVAQTELPHAKVRSNSLDIVGDVMAVAYQTQTTGLTPAGFDLFDISVPEEPRIISHFDASGQHSRGMYALWFVTASSCTWRAVPRTSSRHPNDECTHGRSRSYGSRIFSYGPTQFVSACRVESRKDPPREVSKLYRPRTGDLHVAAG